MHTPPFDELNAEDLEEPSMEESEVEEVPKRRKMMDGAEEAREGAYVVVYRRAGRGSLHRLDADGPKKEFRTIGDPPGASRALLVSDEVQFLLARRHSRVVRFHQRFLR